MQKLLFTLAISCYATVCLGQTNYYASEQTFSWTDENGKTITYIYNHRDLYNNDNKYINMPWIPIDGSERRDLFKTNINLFNVSPNMTIDNIVDAAYSVIPDKYKPALKHGRFAGTFYFDSQTGKLTDIEFDIDDESGFAYIPPEIYYEVEKVLKNYGFYVNPTPEGRKMTYLIYYWKTYIDGRVD